MPVDQRTLRVAFESQDDFVREYRANLANGGVFVESTEAFEINEPVRIELALAFCDERVFLEGEVVHWISAELAGAGAEPGIAVQLSTSASELRSRLEPFAGQAAIGDEREAQTGKRGAPRSDARAPVELRCDDGRLVEGRTRNISDSGMLVTFDGDALPVGSMVEASLVDPKTDERNEVRGSVVRHVKAANGEVMALGIKFCEKEEQGGADTEFKDFVGQVRAGEHSKRLGGIQGSIAELGIHSMLHMFATYSPQGQLVVRRGDVEGHLYFDGGCVRGAVVGGLHDEPALREILSWTEGSFEFLARADEIDFGALFLPIDEAIHDALNSGEDAAGSEVPSHSLEATLSVLGKVDVESLDKTEQAIVDLARVGMTVAKVIEIIPESADAIHVALQGLMERGVILLAD